MVPLFLATEDLVIGVDESLIPYWFVSQYEVAMYRYNEETIHCENPTLDCVHITETQALPDERAEDIIHCTSNQELKVVLPAVHQDAFSFFSPLKSFSLSSLFLHFPCVLADVI